MKREQKVYVSSDWRNLAVVQADPNHGISIFDEVALTLGKFQGKVVTVGSLYDEYEQSYKKNHKHLTQKWEKEATAKGITTAERANECAKIAAIKNLEWIFKRQRGVFIIGDDNLLLSEL